MKKIIGLTILILASIISNAQWMQTNGPPGGWIAVGSVLTTGGNIVAGTNDNGMYLSRDHGLSWVRIEADIDNIYEFAVSGNYAFVGTRWGGVLRSSDHGVTWSRLTNGVPDYIETFAVGGDKIYAGLSDVYVSTDQGDSWTAAGGDASFNTGISSMTIRGNNLFAAHGDEGVFLSNDDGHTWTNITHELAGKIVITLTTYGDYVFAGTWDYGVFRSGDNGTSWTQVNDGLTNLTITSFVISGTSLFAGTINGGVCKTDNNGDLWTKSNNGLNDYLGVLAIGVDGSDFVLGTNGGEIYTSVNSGNAWRVTYGLPCTYITTLAVKGSAVFAGTFSDGLFKSIDNGGTWLKNGNGIPFWVNINTLMVSGTDIYAGTTEGIYVSTDNGNLWKAISNGLPEYVNITSILSVGTNLFIGTIDFGIYFSSDMGASWTPVNNGLSFMSVSSLVAREGSLFAGTGGGAFKSVDNGSLWTPVNQGLADLCVNTLATQGANIIAGTYCESGGVFISSDDGATWSQRLTDLQITSFAKSGADLLASSYSGRIFISFDQGVSWAEISEGLPSLNVYALAVSGTTLFAGTTEDGVFINSTILSGTDDEITYIPHISLYPNPACNTITIEVPDMTSDAHLSIFNTNGQKVLDQSITDVLTTVDISRLPPGMYFLRIMTDGLVQTQKLLKE